MSAPTSETVRTGISGLDLVLGGGVRLLTRTNAGPSAVLLLRGPPGAGKTLLGVQLGIALARHLGRDIAFGGIELLPLELAVQIESFPFAAGVPCVLAPFTADKQRPHPALFAALLDLGEAGDAQAQLGRAIAQLLDGVVKAGGRPGVLILDSLSDGYGLGASMPRVLVDSLAKLAAEHGLVLILLEELAEFRSSSWSFAADTVLELGTLARRSGGEGEERVLRVRKHRFGPCDMGPHEFAIGVREGIRVFPRPQMYCLDWARPLLTPLLSRGGKVEDPGWPFLMQEEERRDWPPFRRSMTAIYGTDLEDVLVCAVRLGRTAQDGQELPGRDLFFDVSANGNLPIDIKETVTLAGGDPYLDGSRVLASVLDIMNRLAKETSIRRVFMGDLRSLRSFANPSDIRRAIVVLATILTRAAIPVILFETCEDEDDVPLSVDISDVAVKLYPDPRLAMNQVYADVLSRRTASSMVWDDPLGRKNA